MVHNCTLLYVGRPLKYIGGWNHTIKHNLYSKLVNERDIGFHPLLRVWEM